MKLLILNQKIKNCFQLSKSDVTECNENISTQELSNIIDNSVGGTSEYPNNAVAWKELFKFFNKTEEEMGLSKYYWYSKNYSSTSTFFEVKITKVKKGIEVDILSYFLY